jgi:hypothetical protein
MEVPPCRTEDVGRGAERRVRGERRVAVRAAALQREDQLGGRPRRAAGGGGERQHVAESAAAIASTVFSCRRLLDGEGAEGVGFGEPVFLLHAADLEDLAAEARP